MNTKSEILESADFSFIRYAQCWEDADILVEGLQINSSDICLSIASGGDNTLALLANSPKKVIALDLNPVQIACLELKVSAYGNLEYDEVLELFGSRPSKRRIELLEKAIKGLNKNSTEFWNKEKYRIDKFGLCGIGKFESYFRIFNKYILPLVHGRKEIEKLFLKKELEERKEFFNNSWDSWKWRLLINIFFSEGVMGLLGRDPAFFKYVEGSLTEQIYKKIKYAMIELPPSENPYLYWIFNKRHGEALPYSLKKENFEKIKSNLHKLEWHLMSLEEFIDKCKIEHIHITKFNLSNIFEYMSYENYVKLLSGLISIGKSGSRLLYWNMMAPRFHPKELTIKYESLDDEANKLHSLDKAFFYNRLVLEKIK